MVFLRLGVFYVKYYVFLSFIFQVFLLKLWSKGVREFVGLQRIYFSQHYLNHLSWLWHLNVPPKVWVFFWKLFCNILPMSTTLPRRGIIINEVCRYCGEDLELRIMLCGTARGIADSCTQLVPVQSFLPCPMSLLVGLDPIHSFFLTKRRSG